MPVASIVGGLISKGGADAAAGLAGQAAENAEYIRKRNDANLSAWFHSGQGAQDLISQLLGLGKFTQDSEGHGGVRLDSSNWRGDQRNALSRFKYTPDYQFRLAQGQKALDMSAASRGNLLSGKQVKASQEYGGNLASGEYNNWFNKLTGVSGQGLTAAQAENQSNLQAIGLQNAALGAQGAYGMQGANALSSGIMNGFNNALSLATFGMGGGFGGMGGGGVTAGPAPVGGYGGYAGYANTLPGFGQGSGL